MAHGSRQNCIQAIRRRLRFRSEGLDPLAMAVVAIPGAAAAATATDAAGAGGGGGAAAGGGGVVVAAGFCGV